MRLVAPLLLPSFLRYTVVGAVATACHYLLLVGAVEAFSVPPPLAAAAGAVLGAVVSYLCNRGFTFAARAPHVQALPRFALACLALASAHAVIVGQGMRVAGWTYLQAQAVATVLLLFAGFALHRRWSFA